MGALLPYGRGGDEGSGATHLSVNVARQYKALQALLHVGVSLRPIGAALALVLLLPLLGDCLDLRRLNLSNLETVGLSHVAAVIAAAVNLHHPTKRVYGQRACRILAPHRATMNPGEEDPAGLSVNVPMQETRCEAARDLTAAGVGRQ